MGSNSLALTSVCARVTADRIEDAIRATAGNGSANLATSCVYAKSWCATVNLTRYFLSSESMFASDSVISFETRRHPQRNIIQKKAVGTTQLWSWTGDRTSAERMVQPDNR
jgi:hypothetical protein